MFLFFIVMQTLCALTPMEHVDLDRYLGKWHEIALIPNWFQKKCTGAATAEYSLINEEMIRVVNQCPTKKGISTAKGVAWLPDKNSPAKLKVSFAPLARYFRWFSGNYWILYVDPDYSVAMVGEPSYTYLWFLARTPAISEEQYEKLIEIAKNQGYDTSKLIRPSKT
ncbi:lipocalin family protein [Candidatus Neptunochlamydia vexilliferae]|uniref:lipocalin family protein n=1 Tax=Candidatus Neptunichlamydia vexilliferae TaxID=1651774 RepID=UPI0018918997|nr:lipocalin family protein [Candidatus Neptunochlamydia vexilliferae]